MAVQLRRTAWTCILPPQCSLCKTCAVIANARLSCIICLVDAGAISVEVYSGRPTAGLQVLFEYLFTLQFRHCRSPDGLHVLFE